MMLSPDGRYAAYGTVDGHAVVIDIDKWAVLVAAAPAVDAYMDSGRDESGFVGLDDVLGARR
ncbi:hypothetical protein OG613_45085 (plasmid) [Streptomyces sp. NBC_00015]|uniref:hypothetical protein n=1 Tax=Streptomyces sp. NBC_00015 TaxID=2903611 RepID=UPI003245F7C7